MAKTYVLVGATSGIGHQVAAVLSGPNTTVYALGRRGDQEKDVPGVIEAGCDVTADDPTFPQIDAPIDDANTVPRL